MRQFSLALALIGLCVGCGGGGGDAPPASTGPSVTTDSGMTDAAGQVALALGEGMQAFTFKDQATGDPVEGLDVTLGEDGDAAVLLALDPQKRYEHVLLDPSVGAPASSKPGALADGTQTLVLEFIYVVARNVLDPPRPASLDHVDEAITREILRSFYWKTVTVSDLDGAIADAITNVIVPGPGDVAEVVAGWTGKAALKVALHKLSVVGLALDLVGTGWQAWWGNYYASRCYGPGAEMDLFIFLGGAIVWVLPAEPVEPSPAAYSMSLGGTVRDVATGEPLSGVLIETDPQLQSQLTDENGQYFFEDLGYGCVEPEDIVLAASRLRGDERIFTGASMSLTKEAANVFDFCMGDGPCDQDWEGVVVHVGSTDPVTAGWGRYDYVNPSTPPSFPDVGPVSNDAGSGLDAWSVHGAESSSFGLYVGPVDGGLRNRGDASGWRLTVIARVLGTTLGSGLSVIYRARTAETWGFELGASPEGDLHVRTQGSPGGVPTHVLPGGGAGYHRYDLVFDPETGKATLHIDGASVQSGVAAYASGTGSPVVMWGDAEYPGLEGHVHFHRVEFSVHK